MILCIIESNEFIYRLDFWDIIFVGYLVDILVLLICMLKEYIILFVI